MHAVLANHYLFGASYPRGGASEIAFHIIPVIEKAGGKVLVRANVSKILVDESSGKVKGMLTVAKDNYNGNDILKMRFYGTNSIKLFKCVFPFN